MNKIASVEDQIMVDGNVSDEEARRHAREWIEENVDDLRIKIEEEHSSPVPASNEKRQDGEK